MDVYNCTRCGLDAFPSFALANSGKLIVECSRCQHQEPSLGPANFNKGIAVDKADGVLGWHGRSQTVVTSEPPRPVSSAAPEPVRRASTPAPGDVIAWIEERSLWLATEEARLEGEIASSRSLLAGARAERKRLQKMLSAGRERKAHAPQFTVSSAAPLELKN